MDRVNISNDRTQLARRRNASLADPRPSGGRRSRKASAGRKEKAPVARDVPFSVKVSRRINYARSKLFTRMGLYTEEQLAPLGMFIDIYV